MTDTITAVVKERTLACSPEVAFTLFTDRIGEWWPVDPHSVAGDRVASITVEPLVGGFVYETDVAGVRVDWALVDACTTSRTGWSWTGTPGAPPTRRPGSRSRSPRPTAGCLLRLVHSGWDRRRRPTGAASYNTGWDLVLDALAPVAAER